MYIILDVTRLYRRINKQQTLTGIDRVSRAYINHYQTSSQALLRLCGKNIVLSSKHSQKLFTWLLNPSTRINLKLIILSSLYKNNIHKHSILINTGHIGLKQKSYIKMLTKYALKPIFFVHDLIPFTHPEYCSPGEDVRCKQKLDYILKYAQGIITNSKATLAEVKSYTNLNIPATVAKLATDIQTTERINRTINKPYFVMLSTIEARKNHLLILQIFRNLAQTDPENTPHLYIIGKRGWEAEQVFDILDRCPIIKKHITEINNCQDHELRNYLQNAQALLFPSFAEGYGLPLIEAIQLNTPVIASNLAVFKEIAADIPEYIDPLDGMAWQKAILAYTSSQSSERKEQQKKIQNFIAPSWQEHFQIVDRFLQTLRCSFKHYQQEKQQPWL